MANNDNEQQGNMGSMANVIEKNIKTLVERRRQDERNKPTAERVADAVTRFTGNMAFVYTHAIIFGIWIIINVGWFHLKPFDPDLLALQVFASMEAICNKR